MDCQRGLSSIIFRARLIQSSNLTLKKYLFVKVKILAFQNLLVRTNYVPNEFQTFSKCCFKTTTIARAVTKIYTYSEQTLYY